MHKYSNKNTKRKTNSRSAPHEQIFSTFSLWLSPVCIVVFCIVDVSSSFCIERSVRMARRQCHTTNSKYIKNSRFGALLFSIFRRENFCIFNNNNQRNFAKCTHAAAAAADPSTANGRQAHNKVLCKENYFIIQIKCCWRCVCVWCA